MRSQSSSLFLLSTTLSLESIDRGFAREPLTQAERDGCRCCGSCCPEPMKFVEPNQFADPGATVRKPPEDRQRDREAVQDRRIYIELVSVPRSTGSLE